MATLLLPSCTCVTRLSSPIVEIVASLRLPFWFIVAMLLSESADEVRASPCETVASLKLPSCSTLEVFALPLWSTSTSLKTEPFCSTEETLSLPLWLTLEVPKIAS